MDEVKLSENFAEMRSNQAHLTEAVSTLNIAVARITTTLEQLVQTQQRQYDVETRVAVLERELIEQKAAIAQVNEDIKDERRGRKADIKWVAGALFALLGVVLGYLLPHLHYR